MRRQFTKAARKRLHRRFRTIKLSREAWGPPDAHLITTPIANNAVCDYGSGFEAASNANKNYLSPRL